MKSADAVAETKPTFTEYEVSWQSERAAQADLLRHFVASPFRPLQPPPAWPTAVVQLGEAQYRGDDVAFALHDGLCEAGFPEFAEHFREREHPQGCAWLDLILGKK